MLEILHSIVQEVNSSPDLETALETIVRRVKKAIKADACSVYLTDYKRRSHVLRATDGLRKEAVGQVELPLHRGLIGLVCERAEPINIDDGPKHPRYMFTAETGETVYHGFLGVPIIQNRKVLGVLVVRQSEPRSFDDSEVTFLFTLAAQLAGAITHAQASGNLWETEETGQADEKGYLQGNPGTSGAAHGMAVVSYPMADLDAVPDRPAEDIAAEEALLLEAVANVRRDLEALERRLEGRLPKEDKALFQAWLLMLDGDALVNPILERIREGNWAQGALHHVIEEHARVFDQMEDSYLRERSSDVRDLGRRILMHLQKDKPTVMEYPRRTILVGEEVSAVQLTEVPPDRLAGVISATGSSASHVAILARGMGIPAVMGVVGLPVSRMDGLDVIVDGFLGRVFISPSVATIDEYRRLQQEDKELSAELDSLRGLPAETTDGIRVPIYLNTGLVSGMSTLGTTESEGVGLYRTELPFMGRDRFPGEMSQSENYREILTIFAPRMVTLRTLDIGGDKPLPYFPVIESNPFLGWRGVRISLDHPEIFLTQVKAMLRAAVGLNNMQIMLPMISRVTEVDELKLLIQRAHDELSDDGLAVTMPSIGVMVEVPAAVYQAEELARRVDFLSIGSNDLTQYLLAVDRNNPRVADVYDDMHPAVLRAINSIVDGAAVYNRPVGLCGELAGNPLATPLLIGMGINNLSMSASSLLKVKWVVRSFSRSRAKQLLQAALRMEEAEPVRKLMTTTLEDMGLGGLVRRSR
jgi:phosphotransferase system, enzyme I, PtsP